MWIISFSDLSTQSGVSLCLQIDNQVPHQASAECCNPPQKTSILVSYAPLSIKTILSVSPLDD